MFLSRLRIKNYRSIKELDLSFQKGKNIIVGKNNSGKSNIIKAIDILLGESSPAYNKLENITQSDFNNNNLDESILLFCVLERDEDEELCYDEMYKCFGFKRHNENLGYRNYTPYRHNIRTNLTHFWDDLDSVMNITEEDNDTQTQYIGTNTKAKQNESLEKEFSDKFMFAFVFRAKYTGENRIQKEIRFFYKENRASQWIMSFSAPIRNEFMQSAIIPSFRDPSKELRISNWSWYGKLLRKYVDQENDSLKEAFKEVKEASNEIFNDLRNEINNSKIKVAFPDTTVSFQFNPEAKIDFYKNALIYVNDGYDSLLQDKGAGIQSAVIIGLFNYYTKNVAHTSCSLLAIEEPELYLHPQARRVMANRLDDFLDHNKHQVIITTHSNEFITSAHEDINIILVKKTSISSTAAQNAKFTDSKEKQILLKIQNAEMFFADKVILVEGGEKYILEAAAKHYGSVINPRLGENWLNEKNCSIISVGGKSEFHKYFKKLEELGIDTFVLADFDFFIRLLAEFFTNLKFDQSKRNALNALKGKINPKAPDLAKEVLSKLIDFKEYLNQNGYPFNEKEIRSRIKETLKIKHIDQISIEFKEEVLNYLVNLRKERIFILKGELEHYYTDKCISLLNKIGGKEEKPIHICSTLLHSNNLPDLLHLDEYNELFNIVTSDFNESAEDIVEPNQEPVPAIDNATEEVEVQPSFNQPLRATFLI